MSEADLAEKWTSPIGDAAWVLVSDEDGNQRIEWRKSLTKKEKVQDLTRTVEIQAIRASDNPAFVQTPATSQVFRIVDYSLEWLDAKNLSSKLAVLERVILEGRNGMGRYLGPESFPEEPE